jgi:hypothetical protein
MGIPVADLRKLKPIFDHTLAIEIIAFILTGIAAIVDFLHGWVRQIPELRIFSSSAKWQRE